MVAEDTSVYYNLTESKVLAWIQTYAAVRGKLETAKNRRHYY